MRPEKRPGALDDLHAEIKRRAEIIGAPARLLPARTADEALSDGMWLELSWFAAADGDDEDGWWYILRQNEDGQVFTLSEAMEEGLDGLMYEVFSVVAWRMAGEPGSVAAARLVEKVRLLGLIDVAWGARARRSIESSRGKTNVP